MSRIDRRNWTNKEIGYKSKGSITDLFDNMFKTVLRITDDEMDMICSTFTDDEYSLIFTEKPTFTEKRRIIEILNKYINYD